MPDGAAQASLKPGLAPNRFGGKDRGKSGAVSRIVERNAELAFDQRVRDALLLSS
jgi:hypothetical protein